MRYLRVTSQAATFEPYVPLIASAAEAEGLDRSLAYVLVERWNELEPWPEARQVIRTLSKTTRIGRGHQLFGVHGPCCRGQAR